MNRQVSLATRAFLLAAIPMALTLAVSFALVSRAVESRIKERLRESMQKTEAMLSHREAEYSARRARVLSVLTENPSLKAGIGLLRETRDPALQAQVHETLAGQLAQMGSAIDCDLLLLEDPLDRMVTGIVGPGLYQSLGSQSAQRIAPSLMQVDKTLYETVAVPINLDSENLGTLVVGTRFDIKEWSAIGNAALIQNDKILLTTFPDTVFREVEHSVRSGCDLPSNDCEVQVGGETYLALPVRQETFRDGVLLISFQSVDTATREFTQSVASVFPIIGGGGVLFALLFSALGARSVAKPLVTLVRELRKEGSAGGFSAELKANYRAAEVNELALEFTRAAGAVRESERRLDEATEQFLESMSQAQDARDPYTAGHSERVSINSTAIAMAMGLPLEQVEIIRIGAKLHDIGKIGIPDAILRKAGKLTAEEYALIQRHPRIGKEILEKVERFKDFVPIVELHHENPNGSGYPYGLRQDEIPLGVRIVHVADVYDAITSDRAYRAAMSEADAWEFLRRGTGPLFDRDAVQALWEVLQTERSLRPATGAAQTHHNDFAFYPLSLGTH
jgi:hypothetical protein